MSTTPHASRTVGGSREDQVGPSEEGASIPQGCDVARRAADGSVDSTADDVATFPHTRQKSDARLPFETITAEQSALSAALVCECCGATEGAFVRFEGLGDYCEEHALQCCGCERPVEAKDAMMCGGCRPVHELTVGVDGVLGWFAKPDSIVVTDTTVRIGRLTVRRDALSRVLTAADKADTELLLEHGWKPYGFHGYWRKGPMGPSTSKAGALAQVRAEKRRAG